jgi:NAD(P)-dependent dehydrogenase (short-subunit alcohol dehydrogenase family)
MAAPVTDRHVPKMDLHERKLVVLGASSGTGQALAVHAVAAGADVLLCGRRRERLEETREAARGGTVFPVDVTDPADLERLGEQALRFGPVNAVVSTVGISQLKLLFEMSIEDWRAVIDTNLIGVNLAIRSLLPAVADHGLVLALSSEVIEMPRWALSAYGASKAALETSMAGWRVEYPMARFGSVVIGATMPTEFHRDFDDSRLGPSLEIWTRHGLSQDEMMQADHVGAAIAGLVAAVLPYPDVGLEHVVLRSPSPVIGTAEYLRSAVEGSAAGRPARSAQD